MNDINIKDESSQYESLSNSIAKILFDKSNPEMITKIGVNELDKFSSLSVLVKAENNIRNELGIIGNIFGDVLNQHLVLRCSLNGWRATQGENVIKQTVETETQNNSFGDRFRRVLGR